MYGEIPFHLVTEFELAMEIKSKKRLKLCYRKILMFDRTCNNIC